MHRTSRLTIPWVLIAWVVLSPAGAAQQAGAPPAATAPALTPEQMEAFLLNARIVSRHNIGTGVTNTVRATLSDGAITHDAQIQTVDVSQGVFNAGRASEVNFKDSYRYNIAGYRLARLLGMDNVPMSVERRVDSKPAAMTWWVDDVQMDEKGRLKQQTMGPDPQRTSKQMQVMRVFDELIQNRDRNQGNILWTADWKMWLIDHTRAFRTGKDLLKPVELTRIDGALLQHLRDLTPEMLNRELGGILSRVEIDALLARRNKIVEHFDARISRVGAAAVVYSLP